MVRRTYHCAIRAPALVLESNSLISLRQVTEKGNWGCLEWKADMAAWGFDRCLNCISQT